MCLEILIRPARPEERYWRLTDKWIAWRKGDAAKGSVRATETEAIAAVIRECNAQGQSYSVEYVRDKRPVAACCANEKRNMDGGCDSCGAPCL